MAERNRKQQQQQPPFRFWFPQWNTPTPRPVPRPTAPTPAPQEPQLQRSTGQRRTPPSPLRRSPSRGSTKPLSPPREAPQQTKEETKVSPGLSPPQPSSEQPTTTDLSQPQTLSSTLESEALAKEITKEEKPEMPSNLDTKKQDESSEPSSQPKHEIETIQDEETKDTIEAPTNRESEELGKSEPKLQTPYEKTKEAVEEMKDSEPKMRIPNALPDEKTKEAIEETKDPEREKELPPTKTVKSSAEPKEVVQLKMKPVSRNELSVVASDREQEESKEKPSRKVSKIAISTIPRSSSSNIDKANFHKEIKDSLSELVKKLSIGHSGPTGGDQGVCIITLAGENRGATMSVNKDGVKKKSSLPTEKEKSKVADHGKNPVAATVNSNVQSINNSLMNDSSSCVRDPGVHLVISNKPSEPMNAEGRTEPVKSTQKIVSNASIPQKFTSEPTVRRRCLRGLLLEPSDDDIEDPQKPRRHGCRVSCDEKKKSKVDDNEGTSRH